MGLKFLVTWLLAFAFALTGCSRLQQARSGGKPEAVVNGEPVSSEELLAGLKETPAASAVLEKLVLKRLLQQEAKKQNVTVDEGDVADFKSEWQKRGIESQMVPILERDLRVSLLMKSLILKKTGGDEARKFYDLFADELAEYEVSHILLATRGEAVTVKKELQSGRSFDVVAAQYTKDQSSKKSKGFIGWLVRGQLRELGADVESVVTQLKPGEISDPVRSPVGYHIFLVGATRKSFEELQRSVGTRLAKAEEVAFLRELYSAAKIESSVRIRPTTPDLGRATPTPAVPGGDEERGTPAPGLPEPGDRPTPVSLPGGEETRGTPAPDLLPGGERGEVVATPESAR